MIIAFVIAPTKYHLNKLFACVKKFGLMTIHKSDTKFLFCAQHMETITAVLAFLKAQYPIAYEQGGIDPNDQGKNPFDS
jgi:hypothetical protein